jgi:HTH-type transcriptional regulator / antitoxin HigA
MLNMIAGTKRGSEVSRPVSKIAELEQVWSDVWPDLKGVLTPIKGERDYQRRSNVLSAVLEKVGDNENHPLASLCDFIGHLIENYERDFVKIKESTTADVLELLMEQQGIKQKDLAGIIPQSNLSAVLNGKRNLTTKQIAKLSVFFNVTAAVFIQSQ